MRFPSDLSAFLKLPAVSPRERHANQQLRRSLDRWGFDHFLPIIRDRWKEKFLWIVDLPQKESLPALPLEVD